MRKIATLFIAGSIAFAVGCGSGGNSGGGNPASGGSSSGGATAAGGSSGGNHASGGSSGGGAAGSSGGTSSPASGGSGGGNGTSSCPLPSCLDQLAPDCVESGDCTTRTNLESGSWNTCFTNGIKEIVVNDNATGNKTMTMKNGAATCFATAFNQGTVLDGSTAITVQSASGTNIASVKYDPTNSVYKVTCTGGQEVTLDSSCSSVWPVSALMGSGCDEGGCDL